MRSDGAVRFLFAFAGGSGHFEPLVPHARAAEDGGYDVAFAGCAAMTATVEAAGFRSFATGGGLVDPARRLPLRTLDPEREDDVLRDHFADRLARDRADGMLRLCGEWRPDLLVCDETDFGSMIAAERLGIPHATLLVMATGAFVRRELVAKPLNELRAEHDLPPDPALAMLARYLVLSPFPPSFRDPTIPLPVTARSVRPAALERPPGDAAPPWLAHLDGASTAYLTLGTIFNIESGDLFSRVVEGLRDLPLDLVVTVGRQIEAAELGPQPGNVHVEQYVPQALILPSCDLVVSHGGSGSVIGALAHGLPLVVLPMGADQALNAARCEALGVGRTLDAVATKPEEARAAAAAVLTDPAYRRAAERLRAEAAALPAAAETIRLLERLALDRRPLTALALDGLAGPAQDALDE